MNSTISTNPPRPAHRGLIAAILGLGLALVACASDGPAADGPGDAGPECFSSADCDASAVCVSAGYGPGLCTPKCNATADDCGGTATCEGIATVAVDICKEPDPEPAMGEAPPPEEEPQIVCEVDADCEALQPGTICAQWKGYKACTIPCAGEDDCNIDTGDEYVTTDFFTCLADEANPGRTACVPDEACFANPDGCIEINVPGAPGGF